MPIMNFSSNPAKQSELVDALHRSIEKLNTLSRYEASLNGTAINIRAIFDPVHFLKISPTASSSSVDDFLNFLDYNPSDALVNMFAQYAGGIGNPDQASLDSLNQKLNDAERSLPEKFTLVRGAISQVHPRRMRNFMQNVVLPWFFQLYPSGKVMAVTVTDDANTYEILVRTLYTIKLYGFDEAQGSSMRRKPFSSLVETIELRIHNIIKLLTQYNGPFLDAFCLNGVYTNFVFIPDESIHRRTIDVASVSDLTTPFSLISSSDEVHLEDGEEDIVRAIHAKKSSTEIEDWLRCWIVKADVMFDRLYNLNMALDSAGSVDFGLYVKQILQYDRVLSEATWVTTSLNQFLRKNLTYAILDKISTFMSDTHCTGSRSFSTQKFVQAISRHFVTQRLPQIYHDPAFATQAQTWLIEVYDRMLSTARDHSFPASLISNGSVSFGNYPGLNAVTALPGNAPIVNEDIYFGQVIRAIRNTHHGFVDLFPGVYAMLGTTSGTVSEEIANIVPFYCFAMIDDVDAAISQQW